MTTADTITDDQIRQLRREAATALDWEMTTFCDFALKQASVAQRRAVKITARDARAKCAEAMAD